MPKLGGHEQVVEGAGVHDVSIRSCSVLRLQHGTVPGALEESGLHPEEKGQG